MKVIWNGSVIAESDETIVIEGNHYFPPESIQKQYFQGTDLSTSCFWKGDAAYYTLSDGEKQDVNAAWYYPEPMASGVKRVGRDFKDYVAFYPQFVEIQT